MNFPVGTIFRKGTLPASFPQLLGELSEKNFNGYIVQTVQGSIIEEGILFVRDGELVGAMVECLGANKSSKGNEAVSSFFNQTKGNGFFHVIELTKSQVDLITAFDEKLLFASKIPLKDIPKLIPSTFEQRFSVEQESSFSLDVYGLSELKKK